MIILPKIKILSCMMTINIYTDFIAYKKNKS